MPWLKFQHTYKHGYGEVQYEYIGNQDLEELKNHIRDRDDADPDGIREPLWEVVYAVPKEILEQKVKEAQSIINSQAKWLDILYRERYE